MIALAADAAAKLNPYNLSDGARQNTIIEQHKDAN
jgi:hypothetical protein